MLAFGYLLQIFSPLRLNGDSATLLAMAVSAEQDHGYLVNGHSTQFPFGYPLVVKTLLQTHVANSMLLIILNLVFLMVGLVAMRSCTKAIKVTGGFLLPMILVLSSWVMVKHVTIPLSEFLYVGVSLLSLQFVMLFWVQSGDRKWWYLALALFFGFVALQCRTVGLSLFPVFIITVCLHQNTAPVRAWLVAQRRLLGALAGGSIILVCGFWFWIRTTSWYELQFIGANSYGKTMQGIYQGKTLAKVLGNSLYWFMLEFGTIFTNMPRHKFPQLRSIYLGWGILSWSMVLYGAWLLLRGRRLIPVVAYFCSYSLVMFLWAGHEERLWLPLFPVLAVLFLSAVDALMDRWPFLRYPFRSYLVIYVVLGAVSLGYSTRISLSGREFGEVFGDGTTRMTYRYAFKNGKKVDLSQVDQGSVRLLRIFEPLAKPAPSGNYGNSP